MFSFFRKKPASEPASAPAAVTPPAPPPAPEPTEATHDTWRARLGRWGWPKTDDATDAVVETPVSGAGGAEAEHAPLTSPAPVDEASAIATPAPVDEAPAIATPASESSTADAASRSSQPAATGDAPERRAWLARLRTGLRKTGAGIAQVFTGGARIDDALYEDLETALLQADAGLKATELLLGDLKQRVKRAGAADAATAKALLADAITDLLAPLERGLTVGEHVPTVIMVVGVNGAGKTTTIGKLTRHLVEAGQKVMLAAADTFRAAAREQLTVWADRADLPATGGRVDIVSQEGGDPAGVTFDAVVAAKARGCDVVIADTAGRLTTQSHLMEELKKVRRVIAKAEPGAPHEVLLVIDGNTGQNALAQVQAFDAALDLTGLVVTKLDGTAKGGVLAAIALWSRSRERPLAVYFIGVGEKLEDLQTFDAREFAQALLA